MHNNANFYDGCLGTFGALEVLDLFVVRVCVVQQECICTSGMLMIKRAS